MYNLYSVIAITFLIAIVSLILTISPEIFIKNEGLKSSKVKFGDIIPIEDGVYDIGKNNKMINGMFLNDLHVQKSPGNAIVSTAQLKATALGTGKSAIVLEDSVFYLHDTLGPSILMFDPSNKPTGTTVSVKEITNILQKDENDLTISDWVDYTGIPTSSLFNEADATEIIRLGSTTAEFKELRVTDRLRLGNGTGDIIFPNTRGANGQILQFNSATNTLEFVDLGGTGGVGDVTANGGFDLESNKIIVGKGGKNIASTNIDITTIVDQNNNGNRTHVISDIEANITNTIQFNNNVTFSGSIKPFIGVDGHITELNLGTGDIILSTNEADSLTINDNAIDGNGNPVPHTYMSFSTVSTSRKIDITVPKLTLSSDSPNEPIFVIGNSSNTATNIPTLQIGKTGVGIGIDNGVTGIFQFLGNNGAQESISYSEIKTITLERIQNSENGKLTFSVISNGNLEEKLAINGDGINITGSLRFGTGNSINAIATDFTNIDNDTIPTTEAVEDRLGAFTVTGANINLAPLTLDSTNSRVGIGTTSPGSKLQIVGDISNSPSDIDPSNDAYSQLEISSSSDASGGNTMNIHIGAWHGTNQCGFIQTVENNIHARNLILQPNNGNVGIGTSSPNGRLHIFESTGTSLSETTGTLILEHGNDGGQSSILFKSAFNTGSDYGFIKYSDDGAANGTTSENGLLEIGVQNDGAGNNADELKLSTAGGSIYLSASGNVGFMSSGATDNFITLTSGGYNHTIGMHTNQLKLNAVGNNSNFGTIDFNIKDGSTLGMRLNRSGYLGIGTDIPKAKLHVKSSQSNTAGGLQNFDQVSLIIANNDDDNCALAMHTQDYALGFHFADSKYIDYYERAYIKGNEDVFQIHFTGQHKNLMNQNIDTTKVGLIVSATNNHINVDNSIIPTINESLPFCILANTNNDKKVFGVISDKEDINNSREHSSGNFISVYQKSNTNERRIFINSVGEGAIWVCNKNGTLENGDYITSTTVSGYGAKQTLNEGFLMNYTVAKITRDCDFSLTKIVKQKLKVITSTDSDGNTTTSIDYHANGDVQFEDDLDENGNQQMVYPLETRFLQADGTLLTDEADYNTRLANSEEVYIACFVGCTYHCG